MKKLKQSEYNEVRLWVYRNARQLELAMWKYCFEGGSKEEVLSALAFYQNADGGFGNALEPDNWNPNSTPYTTSYVIQILSELNAIDSESPMVQGIIEYLKSGVDSNESGWLFNIPSNDEYPHAPWWNYNKEDSVRENIGINATIIKFILRTTKPESKLYQRAIKLTDQLMTRLDTDDTAREMSIGGFDQLRDIIALIDTDGKYDLESMNEKVHKMVRESIEQDTSKWIYHCKKPQDFIKSPDSEFYQENEKITQTELDYLIDTRANNGVWGIDWTWYDNNEKYSKEFAITENWWKSQKAIEIIKYLRNFDRIEK